MSKKIFIWAMLLCANIYSGKQFYRNYTTRQMQQPKDINRFIVADRQKYQDTLEARIEKLQAKNLKRMQQSRKTTSDANSFNFILNRAKFIGGLSAMATHALLLTTISALVPQTDAFLLCQFSRNRPRCEDCYDGCIRNCPEDITTTDCFYLCQILCA